MKRFAALVLAGGTALACVDGLVVGVDLPMCRTPIPVFDHSPLSPADSVQIGCPFAFIDVNGDTVTTVYIP